MKMYQQHSYENIADAIIRTLEQDSDKKVFTLAITGENEEGLDAIIVFEDKSILLSLISVMKHEGQLAARIRGNYV